MAVRPQPTASAAIADKEGKQTVELQQFLQSLREEVVSLRAEATSLRTASDDHETRITALEP